MALHWRASLRKPSCWRDVTLSQRLQVSFLSGFAASWRLQAQHRALGTCSAPRLPRRRRLRLTPRAPAHQARSCLWTPGTSALLFLSLMLHSSSAGGQRGQHPRRPGGAAKGAAQRPRAPGQHLAPL